MHDLPSEDGVYSTIVYDFWKPLGHKTTLMMVGGGQVIATGAQVAPVHDWPAGHAQTG